MSFVKNMNECKKFLKKAGKMGGDQRPSNRIYKRHLQEIAACRKDCEALHKDQEHIIIEKINSFITIQMFFKNHSPHRLVLV